MTATLEGNHKVAAARLGVDVAEYTARLDAGEQWCTGCRNWHPLAAFPRDATRRNGLARRCRSAQQQIRTTPRDRQKLRARWQVQNEIRGGRLRRANDVPCLDCGHEVGQHGDDGRRHEYDHHHGYDDEHALDVIPLCSVCHGARETARRKATLLGHVVGAYLEAKASS